MPYLRFVMLVVIWTLGLVMTQANEQPLTPYQVPVDKLPQPIVEALKARFPKAEPKIASSPDKENYSIDLQEKEMWINVRMTAKGKFQEILKQIDAKMLPPAVLKAVEAKFPKYTIKVAGELSYVKNGEEVFDSYQIDIVTPDQKRFEVDLDSEGKILDVSERGPVKASGSTAPLKKKNVEK